MNTQELSLFNIQKPDKQAIENCSYTPKHYKTVENALNSIFPKSIEETKATRTRRLLGQIAEDLSDEQLESLHTKFQYLIDSWLDLFEQQVFQGKTLKEVLGGK